MKPIYSWLATLSVIEIVLGVILSYHPASVGIIFTMIALPVGTVFLLLILMAESVFGTNG